MMVKGPTSTSSAEFGVVHDEQAPMRQFSPIAVLPQNLRERLDDRVDADRDVLIDGDGLGLFDGDAGEHQLAEPYAPEEARSASASSTRLLMPSTSLRIADRDSRQS